MNTEDMKNILSNVESLKLSDGAYLEFSNMMKKEFDNKEKNKKELIRTNNLNIQIKFHGKKCIDIEVLKQHIYKGDIRSDYEYKLNGVLKTSDLEILTTWTRLYKSNHTTKVEVIIDGIKLETTEKETRKYLSSQEYCFHCDPPIGEECNCSDDPSSYTFRYVFLCMCGLHDF